MLKRSVSHMVCEKSLRMSGVVSILKKCGLQCPHTLDLKACRLCQEGLRRSGGSSCSRGWVCRVEGGQRDLRFWRRRYTTGVFMMMTLSEISAECGGSSSPHTFGTAPTL